MMVRIAKEEGFLFELFIQNAERRSRRWKLCGAGEFVGEFKTVDELLADLNVDDIVVGLSSGMKACEGRATRESWTTCSASDRDPGRRRAAAARVPTIMRGAGRLEILS